MKKSSTRLVLAAALFSSASSAALAAKPLQETPVYISTIMCEAQADSNNTDSQSYIVVYEDMNQACKNANRPHSALVMVTKKTTTAPSGWLMDSYAPLVQIGGTLMRNSKGGFEFNARIANNDFNVSLATETGTTVSSDPSYTNAKNCSISVKQIPCR